MINYKYIRPIEKKQIITTYKVISFHYLNIKIFVKHFIILYIFLIV